MSNPARMIAVTLLAASVLGLAGPAAQATISAGRNTAQVTQDGIGWD